MEFDLVLEIVNRKLIENQLKRLNTAETLVFQGIWDDRTYGEMATEAGYSCGTLTNVVGPQLFRRLSEIVGEKVRKQNCRKLLESRATAWAKPEKKFPQRPGQNKSPIFPNGAIPLDSSFYIERSPIEERIYAEIEKPGALVRIKAPQEMGKTSLLLRVLDYAELLRYRTVNLNLQQVDGAILSDLKRFLRWLCASVTRELKLESKLEEYWDEDVGSKVSCSLYFRHYLLESIDSPLVLALDEVNQIFEYPEVAKDFFPLLRSWYEEAKRLPVWQKLRPIVVHSTEIYVPLQIAQSPFNVGLPIQLNNFNLDEVLKLAACYGLNWTEEEAKQSIDLVGGHPALVHLAIYALSRGDVTFAQLLETAPTSTGIYAHHLQRHLANLQEQTELANAFHTVMTSTSSVRLERILAYKLSSMGLIELNGDRAKPSCQLYCQYFEQQL
jgi:hypothetical protein